MPRDELDPTVEGEAILARIAQRRSCRAFDGSTIDRETLMAIVRDGTETPSSCNQQNWHFVITDDRDDLAKACVIAGGNPHFAECSAMIWLCFQKGFTHDKFSIVQSVAGAACQMLVSAHLRGLDGIWNAGIGDLATVTTFLKVPPEFEVIGALCIGRAIPEAPPMKAPRRPLEAVISWNSFERPAEARYPLKPAERYPFFAMTNANNPFAQWDPAVWGWDRTGNFRGLAVWAKSPLAGVYVPRSQGDTFAMEVAALPDLAPGARVLEVMPWGGTYSAMLLRRYGADVHLHLAELSPHNLSFVTERMRQEGLPTGRLHAELMDGARLPQADASIDVAFLPEVLEHAPEPLALLDEVLRVLKPGGTIVVAARNRTSPWGKRWQQKISREQVPNQGPFTPLPARTVRAAIARRFKVQGQFGIGAGADGDDARVEGDGWAKARVAVVTATRR